MRCRIVAVAGFALIISSVAAFHQVPPPPPDIPKEQAKKDDRPSGLGIFGPSVRPPAHTGADGFTIQLDAEFALENGPIVYRIRLVNRTAEPRECFRHTHESPVRLTRTPDWIHKPTPLLWAMSISGQYGPYHEKVEGGKAATQLIAVQDDYRRIPPGRVSVEFEWDVVGRESSNWESAPRSSGVIIVDEHPTNRREQVRGRQIVEVQPATAKNVARVYEKLEQYLGEATAGVRPKREVIQCLTGSRHPEFVPLIIRAVQLCDNYECRKLLDTIYDCFSDPTAGFERLFPLLEACDPASRYLLDYWHLEASNYRSYQYHLATLANLKAGQRVILGGHDSTAFSWDMIENDLQVWNYSRTHPNSRLTKDQHARIQAVKNVWVRAAYWQYFPEWCSPLWVLCLYADLKRTIQAPDDQAVEAVCRGLAHDRYAVRERAMAESMKMDDRIVPALREYLKRHPSAEFEQRLGSIARHFEHQPVPPLVARVVESAMNSGQIQGELIFQALSGPAGSCRLSDYVRDKRPEQQKRRQEEIDRKLKLKAERLQQSK